MKYVKTLGLAAIAAMALVALVGVGSASATVLCKKTATPCPSDLVVGETVAASLVPGTSSVTESNLGTLNTCLNPTMHGTVEQTGGAAATTVISIPKSGLVFAECTSLTVALEGGALEIHHIPGTDHGTVTAHGFRVTKTFLGASCVYSPNGHDIGVLTGGHPAILDINARETKVEGPFICPTETRWTASFVITSHTELYVEPS